LKRLCDHHYEFTQGYFYCIKCGHKTYGQGRKRRRNKKIGIGVGVALGIIIVGVFLYGGIKNETVTSLVEVIEKYATPITEKIEEGAFALSELSEKSSQSANDETTDLSKQKQAELEVHRLINIEREKRGLKALAYDEKLADVARAHSRDMQSRGYFSHDTPEGLDPTDRANKAGYVCRYKVFNVIYNGIAENIHMQKTRSITFWESPESIAKSAVEGWMDSIGHKQNIVNGNYRSEGIGVSISGFSIYVTQNFC